MIRGITINFEKSEFFKKKITYLGLELDEKGMRIAPNGFEKINKLKEKIPKNKKELQRILGLLNWFRPFVSNMSTELSIITIFFLRTILETRT